MIIRLDQVTVEIGDVQITARDTTGQLSATRSDPKKKFNDEFYLQVQYVLTREEHDQLAAAGVTSI